MQHWAAHLINLYRLIDPMKKLTAVEVERFSQPMDQYMVLRFALLFGQNWQGLEERIDAAYYVQN